MIVYKLLLFNFFISIETRYNRYAPRSAARKFTPTKLNQIPSSSKLQSAPRRRTGNINATETERIVAHSGFSIAERKLCAITANQRKRYAKQKIFIAPAE